MPKDEWGVKRVCPSCATRFYDLQNDPMTCPSCGASFTLESLLSDRPKALEKTKIDQAESGDDLIDDAADVIDDDDADIEVGDDLLDEDEEDNVSLDDLADVPAEEDES